MHIDTQLKNLIKGKRVAIIGPADYVNKELGEEHGKYLDESFDIVIRLNSMIHIENKEMEKYYGSKYNILFSSFWHLPPELNSEEHECRYLNEKSYKNIDKKTILFECYNRNLFQNIYNKYKKTIDSANIFYGNSSREFYIETINYMNSIENINATPTTGSLAIIMVLLMNPKKLYVSGITTYLDKTHFAYYDDYLTKNNKEIQDLAIERRDGNNVKVSEFFDGKTYNMNHSVTKDHPFLAEQKILKHLVTNKHIKVDKYLKELVKSV
jgi:hypothetical protein